MTEPLTTTCPACHGTFAGHGCVCGVCEPGPPGRPYLCPLCRAMLAYDFDLSPRIVSRPEAESYSPDTILAMLRLKQAFEAAAAEGDDRASTYTRARQARQKQAQMVSLMFEVV